MGFCRKIALLAVVCAAAALPGCRRPHHFTEGTVVARVGDRELQLGAVLQTMPKGMTGQDSTAFVGRSVDRWIRRQLKLQEAEMLFSSSARDIEKTVEEYRQALLIRKLEQHYIDRSVDTTFTDDEIAAYYAAHKAEFRLDRTIVKGRIVRFPQKHRQARRLRELMGARSAAQQQDFHDICAKNEFAVDDFREQWVDFSEFLTFLPTVRTQSYEALLGKSEVQEMTDGRRQYYFQITDVRREGDYNPLERLRPTIRRILFNQRQGEVIRCHEDELYARSSEEGLIERFDGQPGGEEPAAETE